MFTKVLFLVSTLLALSGALGVLFSRDIMRSCFYLLASFLGVAGLYLTMEAEFVAVTQLAVYIGGVIILMIFATMITAGGKLNPKDVAKYVKSTVTLMGNFKSFFIAALSAIVLGLSFSGFVFRLHLFDEPLKEKTFMSAVNIGQTLVSKYVLVFEASSVLLVGALVSAVIIARTRKANEEKA